jgi:Ca-activated chloride channel family protein
MQADYVLDYDVLSVEQEHRVYLLTRIRAKPDQKPKVRLPLNLSVVLDRSGSMAGDKLDYVKKAAQFLIKHLGADDKFSLVSYNQEVAVNLTPRLATEKEHINRAIEALKAGGTTNLSGGWLQGCRLVAENLVERQVNRVLLLTDGLANQGVTDSTRLAAMARQKRDEAITTTTMGVGMDFNEDLLTQMASEGGGAFYFIDNPDQAPHIFAEELRDLLSVVGQNLLVTIQPSRYVDQMAQLNTYPSEQQGRDVSFRLGDLYNDEVKTLLLQLSIPAVKSLGQVEIARLRFEYDEITDNSVTHRNLDFPIQVNIVANTDLKDRVPNVEVVKSALLLRAARAREEAIQYADQGDFDRATDTLSKAADAIEEAQIEDGELQAQHDMLREEAVDMGLGAQRYDAYSRKSSTSKLFYSTQRKRPNETVMLHTRLKSSRRAIERNGPTPTIIKWKREHLVLNGPQLRIGRGPDNHIIIPENEVSEYHCCIVRRNGDLLLEDLQSTNGTFANGGRVEEPFRLSVGDVVTVGSWLFMFTQQE